MTTKVFIGWKSLIMTSAVIIWQTRYLPNLYFMDYNADIYLHNKSTSNGTALLENVNNFLNINIYSSLETSGGQGSNLYLDIVHFVTPVLIRHLWQLKTIASLH